ncbi:MAG: hypothetical protein ACRD0I_08225, partial [Acidimicrobiales bacterium]
MDPRATQAAHNNACWCDAVGRSHGLSTRFHPGYWVQDGAFLPLYPNLVTISPHEVEVQLAAINQPAGRVNPGSWSVKDSYSTLELGPAALRPLFDAHWVHRPSAANHPGAIPAPEAGRWGKIDSAKELAAWESAWGQTPLDWSGRPLFQPALLADPDISIIAARE